MLTNVFLLIFKRLFPPVLEHNHVDMKMHPIAANRPGFVHRYQSMYVMDDFLSFLLYY